MRALDYLLLKLFSSPSLYGAAPRNVFIARLTARLSIQSGIR